MKKKVFGVMFLAFALTLSLYNANAQVSDVPTIKPATHQNVKGHWAQGPFIIGQYVECDNTGSLTCRVPIENGSGNNGGSGNNND